MKNIYNDTFKNLTIKELKEQIENYKGQTVYTCDLVYTLLQTYNIDGTYTYSTYKSKELIKKYFDDLDCLYEEYLFNMGEENSLNPFEEPEKFVVCMLLEQAHVLFSSEYDFINENWNNEIELNDKNIKILIDILDKEMEG